MIPRLKRNPMTVGGRDCLGGRGIKIRNLITGEDREDFLPRALYSNVHFAHNGLGFYYVHRSRVNGPRFKFHLLGTDVDSDEELFGEGIGPESFVSVRHLQLDRLRIITVQHGWARSDLYFQNLDRDIDPRPIIVGNGARNAAQFRIPDELLGVGHLIGSNLELL